MLSRRQLLATGTIGLSLAPRSTLLLRQSSSVAQETLHPVLEVTVAAPDMICLELRDGPIIRGALVSLDPPAAEHERGLWLERKGVWGKVVGAKNDHYRTEDRKPARWIDRNAVDDPNNYGRIGELTVTAVYRKSIPYDSGVYRGPVGDTVPACALKHYIYLKLGGQLRRGEYLIRAPAAYLQDTPFVFGEFTRAISIRTNQHGHRPTDQLKMGYLALWLPGGPNNGAFTFEPYNLRSFNVIDAKGGVVFRGSIVLRLGPTEREASEPSIYTYQHEDGTTYTANRSGTYVYGLDYSDWSGGKAGLYRLQIPGLGVSDPFMVSEAAWYAAAKISLAGLYHHRSGITLDGRFGYSRPVNQRPGMTGAIYQSKLPYLFSSENSVGFVPFGHGAAKPWITDTASPEAWGGYMDAGDWDRNTVHLKIANGLLLVYEALPAAARSVSWGIPKSSEILDPSLYRCMDDLPDLLHEVAFGLDVYRRLQDPASGAVWGGIESEDTPRYGEPSYLCSQITFVYAADHQSAWRYAATAARFARITHELQREPVSGVYSASAEAAFNWAESVHANLERAYEEAIHLARAEGAFDKISWDARKTAILKETKPARASAAAALYRLTGKPVYRKLFETLVQGGLEELDEAGDARWDYAQAADADPGLRRTILDAFVISATRHIVAAQRERTNYSSTKWGGIPMLWGQGNAPDYNQVQLLIRAHIKSQDSKFLKCMQAAMAQVLGANQAGMCMTTGLGVRNVRHPLQEDHIAMGVAAPAGITVYGYGPWQATDYGWIWQPQFWAALPGTSGMPGQPDYEDSLKRKVHPFRKSMPLFEYFIEHPRLIMQQEYTVHQTIGTMAMMALYLHGHDGNIATAMPG